VAAAGPRLMVCDISALVEADAASIGALCAAVLAARRLGYAIRFVNCSPELLDLVELCGLTGVLPIRGRPAPRGGPSTVQARRKPEEREVTGGVEEEGDAADAVT
jgi:hypothetical protein